MPVFQSSENDAIWISSLVAVRGRASRHNSYVIATWFIYSILLLTILFTFRDYGITWDEPLQHHYGRMIGRYYYYLFQGIYDTSAVSFWMTNAYGGLFDTIANLATAISPLDLYDTRHLMNALVGLAGIVSCQNIAALIGGPRAGFWAVLLLALTPRYYGPIFNNPKDIPFAVGYTWSIYFLLRA